RPWAMLCNAFGVRVESRSTDQLRASQRAMTLGQTLSPRAVPVHPADRQTVSDRAEHHDTADEEATIGGHGRVGDRHARDRQAEPGGCPGGRAGRQAPEDRPDPPWAWFLVPSVAHRDGSEIAPLRSARLDAAPRRARATRPVAP